MTSGLYVCVRERRGWSERVCQCLCVYETCVLFKNYLKNQILNIRFPRKLLLVYRGEFLGLGQRGNFLIAMSDCP